MQEPLLLKEWIKMIQRQPQREDLINQLLPNGSGIMLLAGRPGVGKTNLALLLGLCLASGKPFLGFSCKRATVTYLAFEMADDKYLARFDKLLPQFPSSVVDNFRFARILPTKLKQVDSDFLSLLTGASIVIIDPLRYLVAGDFIKPQDAATFISIINEIARKYDISFILIHHVKKPQGFLRVEPDDLYQLKGATEYVDAATTVLLLEKAKISFSKGFGSSKDRYILYFAKTRDALAEIEPVKLVFNRDKLLFEKEEMI